MMLLYIHTFAPWPQETFAVSQEVSGAGFVRTLAWMCLTALKPLFLPFLQLMPSYVPAATSVAYCKIQIEFIGTVTSCISSQKTNIGIFFSEDIFYSTLS